LAEWEAHALSGIDCGLRRSRQRCRDSRAVARRLRSRGSHLGANSARPRLFAERSRRRAPGDCTL